MAYTGIVDYLSQTGATIINPLVQLWNVFAQAVPALIAAIVVGIIGWIVGVVLGWVVEQILQRAGFDKKMKEFNVETALGSTKLSVVLGMVVKWYVFIAFLGPAVGILNLGNLSELLMRLVLWAPHAIVAFLIVAFTLIVADICEKKISKAKGEWFNMLGKGVKIVILFAGIIIGLREIGVNISLAENSFLILIAGITLAISLAIGLAFGSGLKKHAGNICDRFFKHY